MSGASERANGRASGPVLQSVFLAVFDHSAYITHVAEESAERFEHHETLSFIVPIHSLVEIETSKVFQEGVSVRTHDDLLHQFQHLRGQLWE